MAVLLPLTSKKKCRLCFFNQKTKIQELLAPRRSTLEKLLFIFYLSPPVSVRATASEAECEGVEHTFLGSANRREHAGDM